MPTLFTLLTPQMFWMLPDVFMLSGLKPWVRKITSVLAIQREEISIKLLMLMKPAHEVYPWTSFELCDFPIKLSQLPNKMSYLSKALQREVVPQLMNLSEVSQHMAVTTLHNPIHLHIIFARFWCLLVVDKLDINKKNLLFYCTLSHRHKA